MSRSRASGTDARQAVATDGGTAADPPSAAAALKALLTASQPDPTTAGGVEGVGASGVGAETVGVEEGASEGNTKEVAAGSSCRGMTCPDDNEERASAQTLPRSSIAVCRLQKREKEESKQRMCLLSFANECICLTACLLMQMQTTVPERVETPKR